MGKKLTTNEVINNCKKIHGNKYDYSKLEFKNSEEKIIIICSEHGEFMQRYHDHLKTKGCPHCSGTGKLNTDMFVQKAIIIHDNKYDYSNVKYKSTELKVNILCKIHGNFLQTPHDHLSGKGCPDCGRQSSLNSHLSNTKIFIAKSKEIHGDKYVYLGEYKNQHQKIEIECKIHGVFLQKPKYHLQGNGCPVCKESKGEKEIRRLLNENGITYKSQFSFDDCKNINKLAFDFYLPNKNICIEFDGRQHFEPIEYFGGVYSLERQKIKDKIKDNFCKNNNIKLIRIPYYEFDNIEKILNYSL